MITSPINFSSFPSFTHPFCISAKKVFSSSTSRDSLLLPYAYTDKGPVEGKLHQLKDGKFVNVFLGIPFAKPPIGQLRFKVEFNSCGKRGTGIILEKFPIH